MEEREGTAVLIAGASSRGRRPLRGRLRRPEPGLRHGSRAAAIARCVPGPTVVLKVVRASRAASATTACCCSDPVDAAAAARASTTAKRSPARIASMQSLTETQEPARQRRLFLLVCSACRLPETQRAGAPGARLSCLAVLVLARSTGTWPPCRACERRSQRLRREAARSTGTVAA